MPMLFWDSLGPMRLSELKLRLLISEIEHKNRRNKRSFLIMREWISRTIFHRNTSTSMVRRIREAGAEVEARSAEVVAEEQMRGEVGEKIKMEEDAVKEVEVEEEIVIMAETINKMSDARNLAPKTKPLAKQTNSISTRNSPTRRNWP